MTEDESGLMSSDFLPSWGGRIWKPPKLLKDNWLANLYMLASIDILFPIFLIYNIKQLSLLHGIILIETHVY